MLALCALTLSLVGLRSAAQPGPKVAVQYGFHDRWNGVHRLDGGVFPRSNSKELALGHVSGRRWASAQEGLSSAQSGARAQTETYSTARGTIYCSRADSYM